MSDRRGRSPARQLNEPADLLQAFLARTFPQCRIYRSVIFASEEATFGKMRDVAVDSVLLLEGWNLQEMAGQKILSEKDVEKMVALIARDHRFHNKRNAVRPTSLFPELLPTT
jgi:hypothetical protein